MKAVVSAGLALVFFLRASGETLPHDSVSVAWVAAAQAIEAGEPRVEIADKLESVALKDPASWWRQRALTLVHELRTSDQRLRSLAASGSTADSEPWLWLAESKMPGYLLIPDNEKILQKFIAEHPHDPATLLINRGRSGIGYLLPLLDELAPTREAQSLFLMDECNIMRSCDLALEILERLSGCSFCEDKFSQGPSSGRSQDIRLQTRAAAETWWKVNATSSFSAGIRAYMPNAGFYSTIRMAKILAKSGGNEDGEFAREALHKLFTRPPTGYNKSYVAEALWGMGDRSGLDVLRERYQDRLERGISGYIVDSGDVFCLIQHGTRAEWEVLARYADEQLNAGKAGSGNSILGYIANTVDEKTSPFAIPALGLIVSKSAPRDSAELWYGETDRLKGRWKAALMLQTLTDEKLGVPEKEPTVEEKERGVDAVWSWWEAEGEERFTFEKIEKSLVNKEKVWFVTLPLKARQNPLALL